MSYDNAVPKPLKFLVSDGKMIDDEGSYIIIGENEKYYRESEYDLTW